MTETYTQVKVFKHEDWVKFLFEILTEAEVKSRLKTVLEVDDIAEKYLTIGFLKEGSAIVTNDY